MLFRSIESAKKKSKGMFSSTGPTKQGFAVGNSCFTKGIPGPMAQFIMALRWASFMVVSMGFRGV